MVMKKSKKSWINKIESGLMLLTGVVGIVGGLMMTSPSVTGNAIADVVSPVGIMGTVFIIGGLLAIYVWEKIR